MKRLIWALALAVLAAALVFYNLPEGGPEAAPTPIAYESDAPLGNQPGERLPDFALDRLDGGTFELAAQRGRATVINLWATWCGPCVKELPYFDALQAAHPEDVAVLAIHSDLITDDISAYLANYDYGIAFAVDAEGGVIRAVGGSTMLPQTLVLDRYGVVVYNQVGSVTYELLEELVEKALA